MGFVIECVANIIGTIHQGNCSARVLAFLLPLYVNASHSPNFPKLIPIASVKRTFIVIRCLTNPRMIPNSPLLAGHPCPLPGL